MCNRKFLNVQLIPKIKGERQKQQNKTSFHLLSIIVIFAFLFFSCSDALSFPNEPKGFRGIQWGSHIKNYENEMLHVFAFEEDADAYILKDINAKLSFQGMETDKYFFVFEDRKFSMVQLLFPESSFATLLQKCKKIWGMPTTDNSSHFWNGSSSICALLPDKKNKLTVLKIGSSNLFFSRSKEQNPGDFMRNEPSGFNGIKWREPASKFKNKLTESIPSSKKNLFFYRNPREKLSWCGIALNGIIYVFDENGFSGVIMHAKKEQKGALFEQCKKLWGSPQEVSERKNMPAPDSLWEGVGTVANLEDANKKTCILSIRRR